MIEQVSVDKVLMDSAKEIFETMIFMDLAEVVEPNQNLEPRNLLGSITFKGGLEGCLGISCSTSCAQAIALNMLGMDTIEQLAEEDTCDAIGEVANMIMGRVKSRLLENVGNLDVSIPSVVSGQELKNNLGDRAEKISVKVSIEDKYMTELSFLYRENTK